MSDSIMKKVTVEEFTRLVKELPLGKELCFAAYVPEGLTDPDEAVDWWAAVRTNIGKEEYTIVYHCGGLTSRALMFDSPAELDPEYVSDFLSYYGLLQDGLVNVEFGDSKRAEEQRKRSAHTEELNRIELLGRVGNLKVYEVGNTKIARLSLCTNRMFDSTDGAKAIETTWHDISIWQENIKEDLGSVRKGDILHVIGRVRRQRYVASNGEERYSYEVVAHSAEIVKE